ncbi:MAG: hypothetical protein HYX33_01380 [Actinobacteria bacterium]|nr:hypothetical protein [Actinomycetota bacterium]
MDEHPALSILPEDVRLAIASGWEGLTVVSNPGAPDDPLTLVCACQRDRVARASRGALVIGTNRDPDPERRRALVISIGEGRTTSRGVVDDPRMRVVIDLGYSTARELVGRAAEQGLVRVLWVRTDRIESVEPQFVFLDARSVLQLRQAVARAAEWHTTAPLPLGMCARAWPILAERAPCLALTGTPRGEVVLVVPAVVLDGLGNRRGRVALSSGIHRDGAAALSDLEIRFVWGSEAAPISRRVALNLSETAQRRLAGRLSRQTHMIVLGAARGEGAPSSTVHVTLGGGGRELIRRAAANAASAARLARR